MVASIVDNFFNKNLPATCEQSQILATQNKFASGVVKSEITPNQQLAEELQKPIIRKFEKRKVHSCFTDNIWGADLAGMELISKFNKEICFLLCVIDVFSRYT